MEADVLSPRMSKPQHLGPADDPDQHQLHIRPDRPVDVHFAFEHQQGRVGLGAAAVAHLVMAVILVLFLRYAPQPAVVEVAAEVMPTDIVWIPEKGPGGGGGGGGNKMPDPPRKAELPGKEKITVPIEKKPAPEPPKEEPPAPVEELNIPAKPMAAATEPLPGAITNESAATVSQGSGTGGGAGTGTGSGIGPGTGSGLGPGSGGGFGGGSYRPGSGVSIPSILREVRPAYTAEAMRAKVQGTVLLECIVMPDGSVGDIKITKSLDPVFGLDQEAIKAARQWKFIPGTLRGTPVPVIITIELSFNLR